MFGPQEKEVATLREEKSHMLDIKVEYEKLQASEVQSKGLQGKLDDLQSIIKQLKLDLEAAHIEKQDLVFEKDEIKKHSDQVINTTLIR